MVSFVSLPKKNPCKLFRLWKFDTTAGTAGPKRKNTNKTVVFFFHSIPHFFQVLFIKFLFVTLITLLTLVAFVFASSVPKKRSSVPCLDFSLFREKSLDFGHSTTRQTNFEELFYGAGKRFIFHPIFGEDTMLSISGIPKITCLCPTKSWVLSHKHLNVYMYLLTFFWDKIQLFWDNGSPDNILYSS